MTAQLGWDFLLDEVNYEIRERRSLHSIVKLINGGLNMDFI